MHCAMPWELITSKGQAEPERTDAGGETFVDRLWRAFGLDRVRRGTPQLNSAAFTIALVSLSAKLAKADGVASRIESETFERLHHILHSERDNVRRIFDQAAQDVAGFDACAQDVARLLRNDRNLMHDVLEGLFSIAVADGILHPEEERHLRRAADIFGFSGDEFRTLRGLFVHDPDDPYAVLGLSAGASNAQLKTQFRRLVREHHPDHLTARGASPEFIRLATEKLAEINGAYARIVRERGP
jgi:DnaJ like chaperone protein